MELPSRRGPISLAFANNGRNRQRIETPLALNTSISLESNECIIRTLIALEKAYWEYKDLYCRYDSRRYPHMSWKTFLKNILQQRLETNFTDNDIKCYLSTYNTWSKSIPTAGVIYYHKNNNTIYFVVVKVAGSHNIWSMPKGKYEESDHTLMRTAIREMKEETGIDVSEVVDDSSTYHIINKTRFYLVETDALRTDLCNYNEREIESVTWVSCNDVLNNTSRYSKQVHATAQLLTDIFGEPRNT
jgi:8-oxo-dGTP pyrophosphatase MutT (NUDIX family)